VHSARRTLLEDIELMPQDQDFGFQPPSRLKAVAQHTDEEEDNYDHQPQSCSDSVVAVTPADGVFGSDRLLANIVLGIVGAAVASAILSYFGIALGGWFGYLIAGFIGACLLIWIARMFRTA
jgi:uncharacterized membrane protein YeaQ/YmgE (transglycosylase-associated protein family)